MGLKKSGAGPDEAAGPGFVPGAKLIEGVLDAPLTPFGAEPEAPGWDEMGERGGGSAAC
jgi:hypothetical protein